MDQIKSKLLCILLLPILSYGQEFVSVCDRTPQVRDAIMRIVHRIAPAVECSDDDLLSLIVPEIKSLAIIRKSVTSLKLGDFSGLSSLEWLNLRENHFTFLPEGIFSNLSSLRSLSLFSNNLTTLPEGIFSGLTALQYLYLNSNNLTTLPEGIFFGLTSLEKLKLTSNT